MRIALLVIPALWLMLGAAAAPAASASPAPAATDPGAAANPTSSALGKEPLRSFAREGARAADPAAGAQPPALDYSRVLGALAIVIALIFLLRWFGRIFFPAVRGRGASRAVEVLARSPVSAKQQVMLLRLGRRVLVVGDSGSQMNALCEIVDPDEVATLVGQLQEERSTTASKAFGAAFGRFRRGFESSAEAPAAAAPPLDEPEDDAPIISARQELSGLRDRVRLLAEQFKSEPTPER